MFVRILRLPGKKIVKKRERVFKKNNYYLSAFKLRRLMKRVKLKWNNEKKEYLIRDKRINNKEVQFSISKINNMFLC